MELDLEPVNILLVDDEPKNLTALEAVLAGGDRRLLRASSGEDALRWLLKERFAVILLDVRMPTMDGFETAALIREHDRSRSTPIIFLTAASKDDIQVAQGYELGAVDYIFKPFDPAILRSKVGVFVDLFRKTEQVRRQAGQLEEATSFLRSMLESTVDYAIIAQDRDGTILTWYEGARRLYGYGAEEMVGQAGVHLLYAPEEIESGRLQKMLSRAARSARVDGEFEQIRKDGSRFTAAVSINQRRDAQGELIGYVLIAKDVTEQREQEEQARLLAAEQAAREEAEASNRRFALLAEVSIRLAHLIEDDGVLQEVAELIVGDFADICMVDAISQDRKVLRIAAAHRDRSKTETLLDLKPPSPGDSSRAARVMRTGHGALLVDITSRSLSDLAPGSEQRHILRFLEVRSAVVVPLPGREEPAGVLCLFRTGSEEPFRARDLDFAAHLARRIGLALENRRLFREAREALRSRDDFFSSAYHDLKTPLAVIKGHAQLLRRRALKLGREGEPLVDGLETVDRAATRMVRFIDEVLDMTRLQSGEPLQLNLRETDLVELAQGVAAQVVHSAGRRTIRVNPSEDHIVGTWDSMRLERVLGNLLSNAIEYSADGSEITIRVAREDGPAGSWAVLSVEDHGIGIPAEDLPHVFDRYFRGGNVAGRTAGTGIGMSGVKQIVEEHNGTIALTSEEGVGTTAEVRLPLNSTRTGDERPRAKRRSPAKVTASS